ncbi:MAG TPA: 16S rRNA (guanine(527)-N(7))-methyltransferase RsmG [Thermoanaerobaculia bacterium]|jgi:16S rRNA (guanine527-N7)-methyltransferase|nr:16S rRNA (guanine(527)-N(7))-methyltransferase RsmG [Thermoanaerobaculia bacterium]
MLPEGGASPPEEFRELLKTRAPAFDLALPEAACEKLSRFLAELDIARRRTNLTGPLSAQELVDHALESALGEKLVPQRAELIDVGSGAGFPGVAIAIVRPDVCVTPVETRRKRLEFLKAVSRSVGLDNVFAHETSVTNLVRSSADVATARAVGRIGEVLGDAPFLKPGGLFLAWTTRAAAGGLARSLGRHFLPDTQLAVPGSRHKVIAAFRKNVPRGTEDED